jgi:hypothetical protein
MRMLLRETRHTEVMALWGRVWMWHALQVFVLFLASNVLIWAGTRRAAPYVALWVIGLLSLIVPAWYYRFRDGPALTQIERQLGQVWGMFAASCFLTGMVRVHEVSQQREQHIRHPNARNSQPPGHRDTDEGETDAPEEHRGAPNPHKPGAAPDSAGERIRAEVDQHFPRVPSIAPGPRDRGDKPEL